MSTETELRDLDEREYLRRKLVIAARLNGETWRSIGQRLGVSGTRAQQLYEEVTWPTDVVQRWWQRQEKRWGGTLDDS